MANKRSKRPLTEMELYSAEQRVYRNEPEQALAALARQNGWHAIKRGWPDFFCWNDETAEIIAIEVKPRHKDGMLQGLRRDQVRVMMALQRVGIRCFVSDGRELEPFRPTQHGPFAMRNPGTAKTA